MSSVLNWICWTPPNKIPGYATVTTDITAWHLSPFAKSCVSNWSAAACSTVSGDPGSKLHNENVAYLSKIRQIWDRHIVHPNATFALWDYHHLLWQLSKEWLRAWQPETHTTAVVVFKVVSMCVAKFSWCRYLCVHMCRHSLTALHFGRFLWVFLLLTWQRRFWVLYRVT